MMIAATVVACSDENEEHVVVVANASRVGIQAVIDRIRTQRNVVHVH